MATIREILGQVDSRKPNAFSDGDKVRWMAELDGKIAADVLLMSIEDIQQLRYSWPEDEKTELLVRFPHDDLYSLWLYARIDFENGEYSKYQNSMEMFNAVYKNFVRWFASTYNPANGYRRGDQNDWEEG